MGFAEYKADKTKSRPSLFHTLYQIENCYQHFFIPEFLICTADLPSLGPQPAACHGSVCCPWCSLMKVKLGNKTCAVQT